MECKINFDNLSVIRGLAALYVVFNHARGHLFAGGSELSKLPGGLGLFDKFNLAILQLTSLGQEAVILFFVLSGFSIAYSFNRNKSVFGFYRNRIVRVYPPYLLALVVVFLVANSFPNLQSSGGYLSASVFFDYLYYGQAVGDYTAQYWSLVYEVVFYFIAPLLLINRKVMRVLMAVIIIVYADRSFSNSSLVTSDLLLHSFLFDMSFYFIVGVVVYEFFDELQFLKTSKTKLIVTVVVFILMLIFFKRFLFLGERYISLLTALASVYFIVNVNLLVIKNKSLHFLGDISYSLYLNHFIVIVFVENVIEFYFGMSRGQIYGFYYWILVVPFCVLFSTILWWVAERNTSLYLSYLRKSY